MPQYLSAIGHNTIAGEQLRTIIERIERLEEEKATLGEHIRDVYAEAKGNGFDVKTLRQIVKLRRQDADERAEQRELLDLYMAAIGMQPDLFDGGQA